MSNDGNVFSVGLQECFKIPPGSIPIPVTPSPGCLNDSLRLLIRVTRFRPLEQLLKILGQIFDGLFSVWQNFEPTLANFILFGQIRTVVSRQIKTI